MEELSTDRPEAITLEGSVVEEGGISDPPAKKQDVVEVVPKDKKGNVIQRNYLLTDSNALKKKVKHETQNEPFNLGTDGSNMVIEMNISFFEQFKGLFINDLVGMDDIVKVDNAPGSKVATGNSAEAFVEYSMDITSKFQDKSNATKLTAYTTTCRIMFQLVGEKVKLGTKSIPRQFVDTFVLPWCEDAYVKKTMMKIK